MTSPRSHPGCVSIYLCGATVQAAPHIGHIRSGLNFDIMRRWFTYRGYDVTFIRNVTDIDDKIIRKAAEQQRPWWAIGYENERAFNAGYTTLGCLPPTYEPRATGHVPEMIEMMRTLIERGQAYEADGNVYFDVRSYDGYLSLSNQDLDDLRQPESEGETGKRDPRDFAMWKAVKPGEPSWETPWGRGRPGWHLECSAMAHKYLGSAFDIHGGGIELDLPAPRERDRPGQGLRRRVRALLGAQLVGHHERREDVQVARQLGAGLRDGQALAAHRAPLLPGHPALPLHHRVQRGRPCARPSPRSRGSRGSCSGSPKRRGRSCLPRTRCRRPSPRRWTRTWASRRPSPSCTPPSGRATARWRPTTRKRRSPGSAEVRAMLGVLGLDPLDAHWSGENDRSEDLHGVVDTLVRLVLQQRESARARKDWATADAIRDQLNQSGLSIEDSPQGPRWNLGPR